MKKLLAILFLLGIAVLIFPLSNLIQSNQGQVDILSQIHDPHFKKAASILQTKCIDCHSSHTRMPFYANFPFAKPVISADIAQGLERFNFDGKLENNGSNFSELDLARLEGVLYSNSMTPLRYVFLHWNSGFNTQEKQIVKDWIYHERALRNASKGITGELAGEPIQPLPNNLQLDAGKVALGKQLFHDTRLSGDDTLSCASCHDLRKGGTDQAVSSTGIRGQIGPINAPTVFNAVYNHRQFWDGRAADLEEQAGGPVTNPMEMGASWEQVLPKLQKDQNLVALFNTHYANGLNRQNILNAIATFEQSLVTPNSKFDKYLRGDKNALAHNESRGYELFKANCVSCHAGRNMGGLSFEKLGVKEDYFSHRKRAPDGPDFGLFNVTKKEEDKHKFKVPSLRNIAKTHPYFHDGSAKSLEEAIAVMARHQAGKNLKQEQIDDISAFLKTLTGEYDGQLLH